MGPSICCWNTKKPVFYLVRKSFVKVKSESKTFEKKLFLRFNDSVELMNDSLDSLVYNLARNLYNTKCKHCKKSAVCKKCEKCKDGKN